jgi:transposase
VVGATGLRVEEVDLQDGEIVVRARSSKRAGRCPLCNRRSFRVHSWYRRRLADLPFGDSPARIEVHVRRFFCVRRRCRRKVFAERLGAVAPVSARRTQRLGVVHTQIGLHLGGNPGARLCVPLRMRTSASTLLRMVKRLPDPETSAVRVLGVDDWAFRKGHKYGTILVDLERRKVVDLLAERTSEALTAWLKQHPGVEIISRDRARVYADGAREGAPNALQVADRFHLLKNAVETLERCLARNHCALRDASKLPAPEPDSTVNEPSPAPSQQGGTTRTQQESIARRERRRALYEHVVDLHRRGRSIRAIASQMQISPKTATRFLRAGTFPERAPSNRQNQLDAYQRTLRDLWDAGCRNAGHLYRELKTAHGFRGSYPSVRKYVAGWRSQGPQARTRSAVRGLSPRSAAWLLIKGPQSRDPADRVVEERIVARLLASCPEAKLASDLALSFFRIVREHRSENLGEWLAAAEVSPLPEFKTFARGLLADRAAVEAALVTTWSNGPVEGNVNRLKLIKRMMYGRAGFALLRTRVLLSD